MGRKAKSQIENTEVVINDTDGDGLVIIQKGSAANKTVKGIDNMIVTFDGEGKATVSKEIAEYFIKCGYELVTTETASTN